MQQAEVLRKKIRSAEELQSIVRSMKVITAVSIHQFESAVESLGTYYETVEQGLQIILSRSGEGGSLISAPADGNTGIIIFGSGQGLCGPFDEVITEYTSQYLMERQIYEPKVFVFGDRILGQLNQHGLNAERVFNLPGTVAGINDIVVKLLIAIEHWRINEEVETVLLFHNKPVAQGRFAPRMQQLLPLDEYWLHRLTDHPWPTNNLPQYTMEPAILFSVLISQYLFVSLYRAIAESLAAEHTSRLSSMQSAEQKIEDWLQQLQNNYRRQRHTAITEELLDIMAGFEVVRSESGLT